MSGTGGQAQGVTLDEAQLASKMFDPVNIALRINAVATGGGGQGTTYSPLFTIFNRAFDTTNNALRVNCVVGCGGGGSGTVNNAPQFQLAYYPLSGSNATVGGTSSITTSSSGTITFKPQSDVAALSVLPSATSPLASPFFTIWQNSAGTSAGFQAVFDGLNTLAWGTNGCVRSNGGAAFVMCNQRPSTGPLDVIYQSTAGLASGHVLKIGSAQTTGIWNYWETDSGVLTAAGSVGSGGTLVSAMRSDGVLIQNAIATPTTNPTSGYFALYPDTSCPAATGYAILSSSGTKTCVGGTPGGSNQQLEFNSAGTFGGTSNLAWNSTTGVLSASQLANANDTLYAKRFTDTSPSGTLLRLQNAAGTNDLFTVDITGTVTAGSIPDARLATAYGGVGACPANQFVATLTRAAAPTCSSAVTPSAAPLNQFATGISTSGGLSYAQPSFSNLSGTIAIPSQLSVMGPSGASHGPGAVPDPGSTAGTTRFLREDATWATPPGGVPSGASGQLQGNNTGAFGGVPGTLVNFTTGSQQFQTTSDAVSLAIVQTAAAGPTSDVFQVFSSRIPAPGVPSVSLVGGGSIPSGDVVTVEITYVQNYPNSTGETTPSGAVTSGQSNGSNAIQITAPVQLGAAAGWNIYAAQCASPGPCTGLKQQGAPQTAFTGTVTLTSITNTGGSPPPSNTALAKALNVDASGNLNGLWTSVTYGQPNTTNQAFVLGYGAGNGSTSNGPFYIKGQSGGTSCSGSLCASTLFPSNSVNGLWYIDSISPGGEGTVGKSVMTNPFLHEGSLNYGHTQIGSLGIYAPTELQIGTNGQCLTSNGADPVWGSCGGPAATFQANGANLASQSTVNFQSGTGITVSNPSAGNVAFNLSTPVSVANGGTGQTTASAAFSALAPPTSQGGLIVGTGTNAYGNLALGTTGQCLQSNGTTVVYGSCGSAVTLQTNGTNNASQSTLNFTNPGSFNGLSFAFSNPSGGNETFSLSGTLNNAGLTNSSATVNGNACALGASCTITLDQIGNPANNVSFAFPATNTFTLAGTAPASSASAGTNAGTLVTINGVTGGATTGVGTAAGSGSSLSLWAGNGGSGSGGTNAAGGAGGSITLTTGSGGASSGTAANANGGNLTVNLGAAGTGGSGSAPNSGSMTVSSSGNTGTANLFTVNDTASNTGTGYIGVFQSNSGNSTIPLLIQSQAAAGNAPPVPAAAAGVMGIDLVQKSAATSTINYNSPLIRICGSFWNGSAQTSCWGIQDVYGAGSNPTETLKFTNLGAQTTGAQAVSANTFQTASASLYGGGLQGVSATNSVTVSGGIDSGASGTHGSATLRGSDSTQTSTTNSTSGSATVRGGNNSGTGTTEVAGNASINGGNCTGASGTCTPGSISEVAGTVANGNGGANATLQLGSGYKAGTIAAANDAVCVTADETAGDCGTANIAFVGVALGTGTPVTVISYGDVLINADGSAAVGNQVCLSANTAGQVHPQATACTAGSGVGVVRSITVNGASATKPLVQLMRY